MKLTDREVGAMRLAFVLLSVCFLALFGCSKNPASSSLGQRIFYTSFERDADTVGWVGISPAFFTNDPAPNCGQRSLRIGGGCLQPTAHLTLGPFEQDGYYRFSVWGKRLEKDQGGRVTLVVDGGEPNGENSSGVSVKELSWRELISPKPVFCPAGKPLQVQLWVGGYVPAEILIDGLAVFCGRQE